MNDQSTKYLSSKQVREYYGISDSTLRRLANENKITFTKSPGGKRYYDTTSVFTDSAPKTDKISYIYCRVSSTKQTNDLERQKKFMVDKYPNYTLITDIGSGLNWNRNNFSKILADVINHRVEEVVIAHKDRLCRFNFDLMVKIFNICETKLTILDNGDSQHKSTEQELAEDLLSIIHIFSCKQMGKRRYGTRSDTTSNQDD